jgi:hypothetical protein
VSGRNRRKRGIGKEIEPEGKLDVTSASSSRNSNSK